jgi:hypothetical protein
LYPKCAKLALVVHLKIQKFSPVCTSGPPGYKGKEGKGRERKGREVREKENSGILHLFKKVVTYIGIGCRP